MGDKSDKMSRQNEEKVKVATEKITRTDLPITPELPDIAKGHKRCPVCKTDKPITSVGDLNSDIPDIYNQLGPCPAPYPALIPHADFKYFTPPDEPDHGNFSLFAAGSIEMGAAVQ
jgi:hypothetical protein